MISTRRSEISIQIGPIGICSPQGIGDEHVFSSQKQAQFAKTPLAQFRDRTVGLIPSFDPNHFVKQRKSLKLMNRASILSVVAAKQLLEHWKGFWPPVDEIGLFLALGMSGGEISDLAGFLQESITKDGTLDWESMGKKGLRRLHPLLSFHVLNNMPLSHVSIELGLGGPHGAFYTSNGVDGLRVFARASKAVVEKETPFALVGGVNAPINTITLALSPPSNDPLSEGAALLGFFATKVRKANNIEWLGLSTHQEWTPQQACSQLSETPPDLWITIGKHSLHASENILALESVLGNMQSASAAFSIALAVEKLRTQTIKTVAVLASDRTGCSVALLRRYV